MAAFAALKVIDTISKLMSAWSAVTKIATAVQTALNLVMSANPIALVIIAIAALIAIGVLLYKNWDKIKATAQVLWNKIKEVFTGIKDSISEKIDLIMTKVTDVFGKIKDIMTKPFETARDTIKTVIDKVKSFLNFNWEFPDLKMPHFKVSGSMNPLKWIDEGVPKLTVDWYAQGGIFSKPTIFNTPYGLKGVGDASSPEVVAPLNDLNEMISQGINRAIAPILMKTTDESKEIIVESNLYVDSEKMYSISQKGKAKHERRFQTASQTS